MPLTVVNLVSPYVRFLYGHVLVQLSCSNDSDIHYFGL